MSQTFQALRCYQCHTFQVQIKKKSKRWSCKLCGEKQSLIKIYGEGSSKDCRIHVQQLNKMRSAEDELKRAEYEDINEVEDAPTGSNLECTGEDGDGPGTLGPGSKWSSYLENDSKERDSDSEEEAESPEIPPLKAKLIPKSKWTSFVDEDSPSKVQGKVKHEDGQRSSSNSRHKAKRQRSAAHSGSKEEVVNCEGGSIDTPQFKPNSSYDDACEPSNKKTFCENTDLNTASKLLQSGMKEECQAVQSRHAEQQKPNQENANVFSSTKYDELDEVLKL